LVLVVVGGHACGPCCVVWGVWSLEMRGLVGCYFEVLRVLVCSFGDVKKRKVLESKAMVGEIYKLLFGPRRPHVVELMVVCKPARQDFCDATSSRTIVFQLGELPSSHRSRGPLRHDVT
jgi:hypothetical protein